MRSPFFRLVTYMAEVGMTDDLDALIQWGREERSLEFKQSMSWADAATKEKLTKSVLAMANLRDGGYIVIGVERQPDDRHIPLGVHPDHIDSFVQDHLSAHFSEYADPYVESTLIRQTVEGKVFLIIKVAEFSELPVICKKDGPKLRRGAMYIRSRRMAETVEVPSQVGMREILDLAIEKRERDFSRRAERLGFVRPPMRDEFLEQLKKLPEPEILKRIWSMGHWRVWIRPTIFEILWSLTP
jgi:predicted HTH transcriptional regulator